ncbi:MAG: hypothetical protein V4504_00215 [Patescibacteria group bacterium]
MKKLRIGILILLCFLSVGNKFIFAQSSTNAGFVPSNIWYSKDPFEEKDSIKIYTLVFNSDSKRALSGSVLFFDNDVLLGKKAFTAAPSSVAQVFVNWQVTVGSHDIYAKIENSKFTVSAGKYEDVYLNENESEHSKRTVNKKIILPSSSDVVKENTFSNSGDAISNIANTIKEKTPDIIAKPILATVGATEDFRTTTENTLVKKENEIQKDLKSLSSIQISKPTASTPSPKKSFIQKPFKYVELFFVKLFSFIFKYKILFYGLSFLLIIWILRFLWQRFF